MTGDLDYDNLVLGSELGRGGQGTVYEVTNLKINSWDAVYKEYGQSVESCLDPAALRSMVDLAGSLPGPQAQWLYRKTAWPAFVVMRQGGVCGFLMRAAPAQCRFTFRSMTAVTADRPRLANLEYLLNSDSYVSGIGLLISDQARLTVLADVAATLDRLHRLGIAIGDLSPKNLLFSPGPQPECFLIDCDATRLRGVSALPQVETPDWQLPAGEEKATSAGDAYKLALLAIRLFAREQNSTSLSSITSIHPALGDLAHRGLTQPPSLRPQPMQWAEQLIAAIPAASAGVPATAPRSGLPVTPQPVPTMPAGPYAGSFSGKYILAVVVCAVVAAIALAATPQRSPAPAPAYRTAPAARPPVADIVPDGEAIRPTPSPDLIAGLKVGNCVHDAAPVAASRPELSPADCTPGAFKVVRIFDGTTDLDRCQGVDRLSESVSSAAHRRVLCLSYLPGADAYWADPGQCVYGANAAGALWDIQACQTGNFTVLARYPGTTDTGKCHGLRRYNQNYQIPAKDPGLSVVLCLSMNYPDDAGYAEINQCLLMSGKTFTNVGSCSASNVVVVGRTGAYRATAFCSPYGSAWWRPEEFPELGYTICWRQR